MYQVIKRDGRRVDFDLARIANAITKAFDAAKIPYNTAIIDLLALQVTADYAGKVRNNEIGVEDIQDSVEAVLQRAGYAAVAKSYILYRKNREKLREMRSTVLDYKKLVDDYLRVSDWRVKENSTVTYSVGGLILSNSLSPPTTGSARSTTRRSPMPTAARISICTTCPCSPATAPAGASSSSFRRGLAT